MLRRYLWIPVCALLLAFVVWRTRPWEIGRLGIQLDPWLILGAVALNVVVVLLWAIRSRSLMAGAGYPLPMTALVPLVSFANTISNLTPASAGEALRAVVLRNRYGVPLSRSTAVILVERLWAIGIMALTAAAALLAALRPGTAEATAGWVVAATGCFAPTIAYRAGLRPSRLLERWVDRSDPAGAVAATAGTASCQLPEPANGAANPPGGPDGERGETREGRGRRARLASAAIEVDRTFATLVTEPGRALLFVASTGAIFTCYAAQLALLLGGLGHPLLLEASWAALGLATVAGVVSALPFGLGATDAVLVLLLGQLGIDVVVAGAAVLLLRATATLPLGIAGALSWAVLGGRGSTTRDGQGDADLMRAG